jgi:hypothetical protein
MSQVIHKYEVKPEFTLELPPNSKVLTVQAQAGKVQMWVMEPAGKSKFVQRRRFLCRATGIPFDTHDPHFYIATFQFPEQALVFHLFEVVENGTDRRLREWEEQGLITPISVEESR